MMGRAMWYIKLIKLVYKQRKLAAKLTNLPIIGDLIEKMVFEDDNLYCLPKDNVIQLNQDLSQREDIVLPSKIAETFIEYANHLWLMNFCMCRDTNNCQDYQSELGCLFLGEAAMKINPKLGRPVSKEEALNHLKRCREMGLVHFIGRVKGDSIWLGVKPERKLLTICSCCPCCCISGLIKDMAPQIAKYYQKMPGVEVKVTDRCVGCGTCKDICFISAIKIIDKRATIGSICRGCGRCVEVCPRKAIELNLTDVQFLQKTVESISGSVDLS